MADAVRDGRSIIVLGGPHSGKTTALREFARYQAAMRRRTIVIDTHGDLGGDGDVAHSALGSARRVAVAKRWQQAELIAATLRDQTPETIVVDDVASAEDVYAVRLALARGVQVLAGCDCPTLQASPLLPHPLSLSLHSSPPHPPSLSPSPSTRLVHARHRRRPCQRRPPAAAPSRRRRRCSI